MKKEEVLEILDEFYDAMKKAEQLAYESCNKMYAEQQDITHIYADIILNASYKKI